MIIKSLKIRGFKGFEKEFYIEFNENKTIIEGENYQGKTSIGEAITWCLLGTNLFGNDKTINIINKNSNTACCELKFLDNEKKEHIIIRSKGKENIVVLDGRKANAEILSNYYYNKKIFLSIFNPYYFSSLEPREQRELLRSVLPIIDYRDAFNLLSQSEREILVEPRINLNDFIKNARDDLKELEKEKNNYEGRKEYANSIANSYIPTEKFFQHEKILDSLEREYELTLKSVSGDTKREMKTKLEEIDKSIENQSKLLNKLRNKYKEMQSVIKSIEQNNSICPVCSNKIVDHNKLNEIKNIQNNLLNEVIKEGKQREIELKSLQVQRSILDIKCNKLNPNSQKEEILSILQEKISRLKLEKEDIQKYNFEIIAKQDAVKKANSDIELIDNALEENDRTQSILKNQISTATSLNNLIIKKQIESVSKYLDRVELIFSKIDIATGELKDDYKILYDGKEYNMLSLSEKIRATLEISNLINKVVGLNVPTFIDNSESVTHYNKEFNNQVILAKVVEGSKLKLVG